ncbi:hypothetical protein POVWA2_058300 [Plasmodium ovale wallikeri]|uniref:Uncharacterized protein n=1 Tax=Plasmodium ovale wallikeri TaxID=864142 RepID=A0A1A8ZZ44_PLAOA|nr:hypothetical protein POVWA1_058990 [Plasmodium ovale wallikeri]SBT49533.1 hypothetical protein POVWA2_058300 [Plasmodium ovale wallikeri]
MMEMFSCYGCHTLKVAAGPLKCKITHIELLLFLKIKNGVNIQEVGQRHIPQARNERAYLMMHTGGTCILREYRVRIRARSRPHSQMVALICASPPACLSGSDE